MKHKHHGTRAIGLVALALGLLLPLLPAPRTDALVRPIIFPIAGGGSYTNDYNAARASGPHHATDIFAPKGRPLVSAVDGTISYVAYPQPSWGFAVFIRDDAGYYYHYIHMNNDTPGTDDGSGGAMNAYAPDMKIGNRVARGQLIGWLGDSGNAETTPPHLHFEIVKPNGDTINPFSSLNEARRIATPIAAPAMPNELPPYGKTLKTAPSIEMGNFDVDVASEMVTGTGEGASSKVKVFNDNDAGMTSFLAYGESFEGGVDVAAGDITGDSVAEIVTGAGPGGGMVHVFNLAGQRLARFEAYPGFKKGIHVAAGDVDNDGKAEIITGPMAGGGPRVKAFELDGTEIMNFYAFDTTFKGGIDVASADVVGTNAAEVVTSMLEGWTPTVRIWALDGSNVGAFTAYNTGFTGGVRVSAGNSDVATAKSEIMTVPANGGPPRLKLWAYSGATIGNSSEIYDEMFIEEWWRGPYDVAAGTGDGRAAAGGNRRATVRAGLE